jgi:hypothetical protein
MAAACRDRLNLPSRCLRRQAQCREADQEGDKGQRPQGHPELGQSRHASATRGRSAVTSRMTAATMCAPDKASNSRSGILADSQ